MGAPLLTPVKGTPPDTRPLGGLGAGSDHFAQSESIRSDNLPETYSFPIRGRAHSGVASPQAGPLLCPPKALLPLYRSGRLAGDVVHHAVDAAHFVDDAVGNFAQQRVWSSAQCAVMKSCVCTARSATTHS